MGHLPVFAEPPQPRGGQFRWWSVQTMAISCLLIILSTLVATQAYNEEMVDDIFGEGGQQVQQQYEARELAQPETRCDDLRACVECSVFHQYWKHFACLAVPPGMQPVYIHQRAL